MTVVTAPPRASLIAYRQLGAGHGWRHVALEMFRAFIAEQAAADPLYAWSGGDDDALQRCWGGWDHLRLFVDRGRPAGIVSWTDPSQRLVPVADDALPTRRSVTLTNLYLTPDARRRGLGARLVEAAVDQLRHAPPRIAVGAEELPATHVLAATHGWNLAAQRTFERCGMTPTLVELARERTASAIDGSANAGSANAGKPDAGRPDAGRPDAGRRDTPRKPSPHGQARNARVTGARQPNVGAPHASVLDADDVLVGESGYELRRGRLHVVEHRNLDPRLRTELRRGLPLQASWYRAAFGLELADKRGPLADEALYTVTTGPGRPLLRAAFTWNPLGAQVLVRCTELQATRELLVDPTPALDALHALLAHRLRRLTVRGRLPLLLPPEVAQSLGDPLLRGGWHRELISYALPLRQSAVRGSR